ncbi:MAG: hypothetical protein LBJ38_03800 [Oscillospiraceae bacterium]|jgi:hypothetical protein|nr:hypothetical protein [Oscillospiraceae bacterium]
MKKSKARKLAFVLVWFLGMAYGQNATMAGRPILVKAAAEALGALPGPWSLQTRERALARNRQTSAHAAEAQHPGCGPVPAQPTDVAPLEDQRPVVVAAFLDEHGSRRRELCSLQRTAEQQFTCRASVPRWGNISFVLCVAVRGRRAADPPSIVFPLEEGPVQITTTRAYSVVQRPGLWPLNATEEMTTRVVSITSFGPRQPRSVVLPLASHYLPTTPDAVPIPFNVSFHLLQTDRCWIGCAGDQ